jgi:7,8-dihydropterin-6-yl-methyl-4-(beta-D-ribofuranosyl)aminobenzene 5'-phosphate synthase
MKEIKYEKDQLYGIYGGLHISPFEDWDPKYDDLVLSLGNYGFKKIGCNHCTGILCAKKFVEVGYPVVKGTARHRSKEAVYLGNGDKIGFGIEV